MGVFLSVLICWRLTSFYLVKRTAFSKWSAALIRHLQRDAPGWCIFYHSKLYFNKLLALRYISALYRSRNSTRRLHYDRGRYLRTKWPYRTSTSVPGHEKRRGITWAMTKQRKLWLSRTEFVLIRPGQTREGLSRPEQIWGVSERGMIVPDFGPEQAFP